jgi:hypothetical protein
MSIAAPARTAAPPPPARARARWPKLVVILGCGLMVLSGSSLIAAKLIVDSATSGP